MSREPGPLHGILPSRHWCIPARQMAGATIRGPRAIFGLSHPRPTRPVVNILPKPRCHLTLLLLIKSGSTFDDLCSAV